MRLHFLNRSSLLCLLVHAFCASCGFTSRQQGPAPDPNGGAVQLPPAVTQSGGDANAPAVAEADANGTASGAGEPNFSREAAVLCPVEVTYESRLTGQQKSAFEAAYPSLTTTLEKAIQTNCATLFASQQEVPAGKKPVELIVVNESDTIAYASVGEDSGSITVSAKFFLERASQNDSFDALGALHHEAAHLYQQNRSDFPIWAIEGMADFVRYRSGYVKLSERRRGGNYDDAYNTTAFFFDYLERQHPGVMHRMLQAMGKQSTPYTARWFTSEAGAPLAELWAAYQASLED